MNPFISKARAVASGIHEVAREALYLRANTGPDDLRNRLEDIRSGRFRR